MQRPTYYAIAAWQLGKQCGVKVDQRSIDAGFQFVTYGTNKAGNTAYGGEFTMNNGPVDTERWMAGNRTGNSHKSGMAYLIYRLSPGRADSEQRMKLHLSNINAAYKDMPDGHACPLMGLTWGWAGVFASGDEALKKKVGQYFIPWLNMARCHGSDSYVILPGRNYADGSYYQGNIRNHTTSAVAFLYSYSTPKLQVQGVNVAIPGVNHLELRGAEAAAYKFIVASAYGKAAKALVGSSNRDDEASDAGRLTAYIAERTTKAIRQLFDLEIKGKWASLQQQFADAQHTFAGVSDFDKQAERWNKILSSEAGRQMIRAHKALLDGQFGTAMSTLHSLDAQGGMAAAHAMLLGEVEDALFAFIEECQALYDDGKWDELKRTLNRERSKMAGAALFEASAAEWNAGLNTAVGSRIVSADSAIGRGRLGSAWTTLDAIKANDDIAAIIVKLRGRIELELQDRVQPLKKYESWNDWYALNKALPTLTRDLRGVPAFDQMHSAWQAKLRQKDVQIAINAGRRFESLEAAWSRAQSTRLRGQLEAFVRQYGETVYADRAKALLAE